jgi:phenylacetate-CoA ligase
MIFVRGVNLYPSAVEKIVRTFQEIGEYRVEVRQDRAMAEVNLLIEPTSDCRRPRTLTEKLESALESAFALRIPVTAVTRGTLPQFEMKAKRWTFISRAHHGEIKTAPPAPVVVP